MRTSLNEIRDIEDHVFGYNDPASALLFEARLILDTQLRENLVLQQSTYQVIQKYGRESLKKEIRVVHQKLMEQPEHQGFMQKIMRLFLNR